MNTLAELNIDNFRAIKKADIKLNGITVVSGINGCGKSTIAKLIYYIFHHANGYERLAINDYVQKCRTYLEAIGQILSIADNPNEKYIRYRYHHLMLNGLDSENDIDEDIKNAKALLLKSQKSIENLEKKNPAAYSRLLMILKATLKISTEDQRSHSELINLLFSRIEGLRQSLHNDIIRRPYRLLREQVCIDLDPNVSKSVSLKEYNIPIFGKNVTDVPIPHYVKRVAMLDTPMIIGMDTFPDQPSYWREINDLARRKPKRGYKLSINNKIKNDILQGEALYEEETFNHGFIFKDKDGSTFDLLDCATGIKTFSLLQMLLKNRFLEEDTMLVLDEPESHLHPQWITELANLIVMIHEKIGTKFFITSHSTDMVSGLRYISERNRCLDSVSFYLAKDENKDGKFTYQFLDKDDIDPIFASFNQSIEKQDEYTK